MRTFEDDSGPSGPQWAAIKAAADSGGDVAKACLAAGLDERLGALFVVVSVADAACEATEKAGIGAEAEAREGHDLLRILRNANPVTLEEGQKIRADVRRLQSEYQAAHTRADMARIARTQRAGLREMFPGYFGITRRIPLRDDIPGTVREVLTRLGLPTGIVEPWQHLIPLATVKLARVALPSLSRK